MIYILEEHSFSLAIWYKISSIKDYKIPYDSFGQWYELLRPFMVELFHVNLSPVV